MKALVVCDSYFGNTKIIADSIAKELGDGVNSIHITDLNPEELNSVVSSF